MSAHTWSAARALSLSAPSFVGASGRNATRTATVTATPRSSTATPSLGVLPVFGILRRCGPVRAVRQSCSAAYGRRLRVLSLDAVVGIFCACGAHKTPSFIIPVRSPLEATRDAGVRGGRKTRRGARKPDGARAPSGFVQKFWRHPREAGYAYGGTPPVTLREAPKREVSPGPARRRGPRVPAAPASGRSEDTPGPNRSQREPPG